MLLHRVINKVYIKCFRRVKKMIEGGGKKALGGDFDDSEKFIAPTVLSDVQFSDPVMQDEVGNIR